MKKLFITSLAIGGLTLATCMDVRSESIEKSVTGEGPCARCILKEKNARGHQITITETTGGNAVTYYLAPNDVTRLYGHKLCMEPGNVAAVGTVEMVDGRLTLTPSRIESAKN